MSKCYYPCDDPVVGCPFDAVGGLDCYNKCGVGAYEDEDGRDEAEDDDDDQYYTEIHLEDVDESMNPYDGTYDWENDNAVEDW